MWKFIVFFVIFGCCVYAADTHVDNRSNTNEDDLDDEGESGSGSMEEQAKFYHTGKNDYVINQKLKPGTRSKNIHKKHIQKSTGKWFPMIHKLWNFWRRRGAREVMDSIASKLVSHTSDKLVNHIGTAITSGLANRKSGVSTDISKDKSLSSATEVVIPALSVSKLSELSPTNKTNDLSNSTRSSNETKTEKPVQQRNAIADGDGDSTNEETGQSTGSSVQSIGPMEGIEIKVNGSSSTFNNFTKLNKEHDNVKGSKVHVLKFAQDRKGKGVIAKKGVVSSKQNKSMKHHHHQIKKMTKKTHKKKTKKNVKKSNVSNFPKIILYQGPISKALENILKARSSSFVQTVNSPMSFEEATKDIKRSHIAREDVNQKNEKIGDEDDEEGDEEEDDEEEKTEDSKKKSKVARGQRKYSVKGYHDNGKPDKKSYTKKNKNEIGNKKNGVLLTKTKGSSNERKWKNEAETSPAKMNSSHKTDSSYLSFPKQDEKRLKHYKPSIVPNDELPSTTQFNDFIKQINSPISTPDTPFFAPPDFEYHVKSIKPNKHDESKPNSIIGNTPKPSPNVMEGNLEETSGKYNNKEAPNDGYEFEYPNPAGYTTLGNNVNNDDDADDDDNESQLSNDTKNGTNGSHPIVIQAPLQTHPSANPNPGLPKPVLNAPDPDAPVGFPLAPTEEDPSIMEGHKPTAVDEDNEQQPETGDEKPDEMTGWPNAKPLEPVAPNPALESELIERIQANSRNIASLSTEVKDIESKLEEVGTTVDNIEKDIQRIARKNDEEKILPAKNFYPGPSNNLPFLRPSGNIPIELVTGGKFPVRLPVRPGHRRPKILKQFFIPLPPPNSPAAQRIENGAPLPGLPFPLNQVISFLLRKMRKNTGRPKPQGFPVRLPGTKFGRWHPPQALPDVPLPPREHDLDRLELEMGRVPISRVSTISDITPKKPKIILFTKSPNIMDLTEKPCDEPCQNGGECIGGNVCKCRPMFTGPKCEEPIRRSNTPGDIMDLLGPLPLEADTPRSRTISLPLIFSENNDDSDASSQRTMAQVDQSKLVDMLSQFSKNVPDILEFRKRSSIPHTSNLRRRRRRQYERYPYSRRIYQ